MLTVPEPAFQSDVRGVSGPPRVPGSVRRTSTIDIVLDTGPRPQLLLDGRARDLRTTSTGHELLGQATMSAAVDLDSGILDGLTVAPPTWQGPLQALVGQPSRTRFRRSLATAAPELVQSGGPLALLLDDVPVCVLISGNLRYRDAETAVGGGYPPADVCAGWQQGGRLVTAAERSGESPLVEGPPSGELADPDDPVGWHDLPPLGEWSMRRARRLDLVPEEDGTVRLVAYLRDVRRLAEPAPRAVHEYSVVATIEGDGTIRSVEATPHVLPAPECPQAAASAQRFCGRNVAELRDHVTKELVGVSTCTHLNDTLRAMGATRDLLAIVDRVEHGRTLR